MSEKLSCVLTYELKQETPIIHFQHNQSGATLRATEVKPKLDRFIIKKLGGVEKIDKSWFIGSTAALNYKMQITASGEPVKSQTIEKAIVIHELDSQRGRNKKTQKQIELERELKNEINEMYFGNMVSKNSDSFAGDVRESYKETLFFGSETKIELKIICIIEELRNTIVEYIEEFFLVHNFGTRQSKGFGGFSIKNSKKRLDPIKELNNKGYRFFYTQIWGMNLNYRDMLNHAKNIYTVLKGGYNHTGWKESEKQYSNINRYIKGYLQRQFLDDFMCESIGSDKAFIKSKKKYKIDRATQRPYDYPSNRKGQAPEYVYNDYRFIRALFGLADYYEFKDEARSGKVEIFSLGETSFDVERFKSPITIKIVGNYIIFIFGSFDEICNKTFYFSPNGYPAGLLERKEYNEKKEIIESRNDLFVKIQTPEKFDNDDVTKFIAKFVDFFNSKSTKLKNFNRDISVSSDIKLIIPEFTEV